MVAVQGEDGESGHKSCSFRLRFVPHSTCCHGVPVFNPAKHPDDNQSKASECAMLWLNVWQQDSVATQRAILRQLPLQGKL